jgi:hypothetical protein
MCTMFLSVTLKFHKVDGGWVARKGVPGGANGIHTLIVWIKKEQDLKGLKTSGKCEFLN